MSVAKRHNKVTISILHSHFVDYNKISTLLHQCIHSLIAIIHYHIGSGLTI